MTLPERTASSSGRGRLLERCQALPRIQDERIGRRRSAKVEKSLIVGDGGGSLLQPFLRAGMPIRERWKAACRRDVVEEHGHGLAATLLSRLELGERFGMGIGLHVGDTQTVYRTGETMTVTAKLSPGSSSSPVDAYVVAQLPTGQLLSLQLGRAIVPGIVPIARGIVPISYEAVLVSYTFSGIEPPGAYTWYSVLTRPGTLEFVTPLQQVAFTLDVTH